MTLEAFFEKFDLFADAPDAVAKMRELVRHLAVTGKLVGQDPCDEHADELIARIAEQRHAKKAKEYQPVTAEEAPYELPFSWSWVRMGNISLTSDSGWSPQCLPESRTGTEWGVLKVSAVSWGVFKPEENKALPPGMTSRPDCEVKAGDFLLSRANTEELVARSVVVDQTPPRLMMSDKIVRFTFPDEIERAFINLANSSVHSRAYYARNASGTSSSMKNIGREVMCNLPIPLPPLAEQKRIVAKVDELMALCDRLEAQQQEREEQAIQLARASLARFADAPTPANLEYLFHSSFIIPPSSLRRSILTLAVQGKLVPQDPNDEEPEAALLELHRARIRQAKAGKLRAAKVPANAFLEEPLPFIPDSWRTVSFDHLAVAHNNALKAGPFGSALKKEFYVEKGYKIYGQEQVIAGDPFIGDYYIDEKKFAELESCAVSPGDILISLVGTIGKLLVLSDGIEPGIINPRVIKLGLDPTLVYPMFIKVLIGSPYAVDFFEENSHGGTMNILNLSILRALPVPLPPLAEQRRIVAKVEQLMALVDALETQLAASRATAANLLSALVAELTQPL
jgi:type I restriction enzyme S subunit